MPIRTSIGGAIIFLNLNYYANFTFKFHSKLKTPIRNKNSSFEFTINLKYEFHIECSSSFTHLNQYFKFVF